jgi:hypothetical protein
MIKVRGPDLLISFPSASFFPAIICVNSSVARSFVVLCLRPQFLWPFSSSFRFSHSSFPDRPWLAPHASRGERGKKGAVYEGPEKTATGFTPDGKLRTEPRTGPWTGGRGVDWVRERGMNRSWGSKFPEL